MLYTMLSKTRQVTTFEINKILKTPFVSMLIDAFRKKPVITKDLDELNGRERIPTVFL